MQKTTAALELKQLIVLLERRQIEEGNLLKKQFTITYDSMKPLNVLRKLLLEFGSPSDIKDDLVQTATGVVSGFLTRRLLGRSSKNTFIRLAGIYLQHQVSNFIANHSDSIKVLGQYFIMKLSCHFHNNKT
jgi:hypothetical protein